MFRQARKRFLNFWAITGLIFSGILTSFIVHDMMAQDVSGGASSSTSVVTGTDEECKETETGRISGIKCIIHTHVYTETSVDTKCTPKTYVAPTDNSNYCITQKITISATNTGEDTPGKTIKTYGPCRICGAAYPGTNPVEISHTPTWPTIKWAANDCGAKDSNGDGAVATFTAYEVSTSVNSSSVVFSEKSPGICSICGAINALFNPSTTNFTVEKVESVTCENIISTKADPKKPETLYLANKGWDKTPDPDELTKTITAKLKPDDATPTDDKSWTGDGIQAPSPANSLTATWKSKEFKIHALSYGCAHSKKALNIAVEGASIVSAVADSDEEMTEKYLRVFVNEDFTKGKDASPVLDGHYKCKIPDKDVDDYEPSSIGRDELVGFSLAWLKYQGTEYDDTSACLQLAGYEANAKIYVGANENDMKLYDGSMKNIDDFWKLKGCMRIEGIAEGQFTLQLKMQTRDELEAVLVDQVNVKVFSLNMEALDPSPSLGQEVSSSSPLLGINKTAATQVASSSADAHEICDKNMIIVVNDNDSDNDGKNDLDDYSVSGDKCPDGDPDLAIAKISKPSNLKADDMAGTISLALSKNLKAYLKRDKSKEAPLTYSYSDFGEKGYIELFIEGREPSKEVLDSTVEIEMPLKDGSVCRDGIKYTVIQVKKAKLTIDPKNVGKYSNFILGKVYVPTKYGGILVLTNNSKNSSMNLYYSDGADMTKETAIAIFTNAYEDNKVFEMPAQNGEYKVPEDKYGWYYFKLNAEKVESEIWASFRQEGRSEKTPWNAWYWPFYDGKDPNLYDKTGAYTPCEKYDKIYKTKSVKWEKDNCFTNIANDDWCGHCGGFVLASIDLPQPEGIKARNLEQEEMKGLYIAVAQHDSQGHKWLIGSQSKQLPAKPCSAATGEAIDAYPGKFHDYLCAIIMMAKKPLFSNLRALERVGDENEIWNHSVYYFFSPFEEADGGNERIIKINTSITSNVDTQCPADPKGARPDSYEYILEFVDGEIKTDSSSQNWISCSGYPPGNAGYIPDRLQYDIPNSHPIDKNKIDELYK